MQEIVLSIMLEDDMKFLVISNANLFMIKSITHLKYSYAKSMIIKKMIEINMFMVNAILDMATKIYKRLYL